MINPIKFRGKRIYQKLDSNLKMNYKYELTLEIANFCTNSFI